MMTKIYGVKILQNGAKERHWFGGVDDAETRSGAVHSAVMVAICCGCDYAYAKHPERQGPVLYMTKVDSDKWLADHPWTVLPHPQLIGGVPAYV